MTLDCLDENTLTALAQGCLSAESFLWMMLTHYHGQTWNTAEISSSLGISDHLGVEIGGNVTRFSSHATI